MNLKMFFLIKKLLDIKWKESNQKKHKIGTYEIDKISLSCFDDKKYVLYDGIHTLDYFYKDCDNKKRLWWWKNIVIMKKDCDNKVLM